MAEMNSQLDIVMHKVKTANVLLPNQKYIIGKTIKTEEIGKTTEKGMELALKMLTTYIL